MNDFRYSTRISEIPDPLDWTLEKTALLVRACREMAHFHQAKCPEIRALYRRRNFNPEEITTEKDLQRIPALGVTAMKTFLIQSLPEEKAVLKLTSSGTRGQKTQIWFDQPSLDRVQRMLDVLLEQEGIVSREPYNYLVLNYDPDQAGDLGIAYTEKNQLRFAPVKSVYYAIRKDSEGNWKFEKEKALQTLQRYQAEGLPVRIFAMPAFLNEFLDFLRESRMPPFQFKSPSWILTGGGWKAAEDKKITRERLRGLCVEWFGIPDANQRDAYGMAEHCAPYFECREHRLHVPVFNRVWIRDPKTYEVLPDGEVGLMELLTPFNAMMPTLSLMTTDYGRIHAEPCRCAWKSPTFEVLGRAGIAKHKGCAISAQEIVRRK